MVNKRVNQVTRLRLPGRVNEIPGSLWNWPRKIEIQIVYSRVVLDGEVLSADHSVSLEPFPAELLGSSIGGVGPLDGDTVVVGVLLSVGEGVARHSHEDGLLGVENSASGVNTKTLHVGRLDGPSDTASRRVDNLK